MTDSTLAARYDATPRPCGCPIFAAPNAPLVWRDLRGMRWDAQRFLAAAAGKRAGYTLAESATGVSLCVSVNGPPANLFAEDDYESLELAQAACQGIEEWLNNLGLDPSDVECRWCHETLVRLSGNELGWCTSAGEAHCPTPRAPLRAHNARIAPRTS